MKPSIPAVRIAEPSVKSRIEARRNLFLPYCKSFAIGELTSRACWMAAYCDGRATPSRRQINRKKDDPPGGTTGRVGCGTGWMRRPCRTQDPRRERFRAKWVPVRV